jgi:small multidrug resistance pump
MIEKNRLAVAITIAFSVLGVLGDYLLKLASAHKNPPKAGWFSDAPEPDAADRAPRVP